MYEPFNREQVELCNFFGLRQYLRPDNHDPQFLTVASRIFTGRIRNGWINQYNRAFVTDRRLIKDVRSNLMLKWVCEHFPGMKIVFVMRHPCAVALSKVRLGWKIDLKRAFLDQSALVDDHLGPFMSLIEDAKSEFEQHLVAWCIENLIPTRQLSKTDAHFVQYEHLVEDAERELRGICTYLGKPFTSSMLRRLIRRSTTSRRKGSTVLLGAETWRKHISEDELAYAERVVNSFGLQQNYFGGQKSLRPGILLSHNVQNELA
jgi:hypothetical protein